MAGIELHVVGAHAWYAFHPTRYSIAQMKVKMEDMAQEFGDMLKETLDRMRERIEVGNLLRPRVLLRVRVVVAVPSCNTPHVNSRNAAIRRAIAFECTAEGSSQS